MLIALVAINAAACIAGLCVHAALMRHLREHHPHLWMRFQTRPNPARDANETERVEIITQFTFAEYLRSGAWRGLGDARLERLISTRRFCFYAVCLTMSAALIALFLPTR